MLSKITEFLTVAGPGIVTSLADNDAGGVTTYSVLGATFGYQLLWVLLATTVALAVIQEITVRIAVTTGKGLSDLIRESFDIRGTLIVMGILLLANMGTTIANFAGIAAAMELLNIPRYLGVPLCAVLVWVLATRGSYRFVEKMLLSIAAILIAYIGAGFLAHPQWWKAAQGLLIPSMSFSRESIFLVVATVGTTITPWMQFYLHSSVVEKGVGVKGLPFLRLEVFAGAVLSNFIAFFIVVACAATLHMRGIPIQTAEDAALALQPLVGSFAEILFAGGLFAAALLGIFVVPISTAYALSEAFGMEHGVSKRMREAPFFYGLYFFMLVVAALFVLLPRIPLIPVIVLVECTQGILLPVILCYMLRLANDRKLMGRHVNSFGSNILGGGTAIVLVIFSVLLVGDFLIQLIRI